MEYNEILKKLIGPTCPVGESNTDEKRYKALEETSDLVIELIHDLKKVSGYKERVEHSMRKSGELAQHTLDVIKEIIE